MKLGNITSWVGFEPSDNTSHSAANNCIDVTLEIARVQTSTNELEQMGLSMPIKTPNYIFSLEPSDDSKPSP